MKKITEIVVYRVLMALGIMAGIFSCSDSETRSSHIEIRMTDAPADYQEVNIDIQDVQVNPKDDSNSGWQSIPVSTGVYNLLKLSNGLDTLLGTADLPAGRLTQIRLVLGNNNSLKLNNVVYDLTTPSAQQSGLKLLVNTELKGGVTYKFVLDFDAARSIVSTGSGKFILKPVIRTVTTAQSGAIEGAVDPIVSGPVVHAIIGTDTVSTYASTTGSFLLKGLSAGTYRLVFVPKTGFQTVEKTGVVVTIGSVTTVGTVTIRHNNISNISVTIHPRRNFALSGL